MLDINNSENIKKIIYDFFSMLQSEVLIESAKFSDGVIFVKIKTEEPKILIGENGQTLSDIQHILRVIIKKKTQSDFYLDIDINSYKEKKMNYLKETAKSAAEDVILTGKEKILPAMSAYERRIVHMELANRTDIKTTSMGEEPSRRIVITPNK